ncbi:MAG: hypothetical protein IPL83_08580 [Bdellovibrionales bacterium]|nr:hypothetical protein [Bdellovibrionales bacterium]
MSRFLKVLQELSRNQKIHAKISLDPDMVGLPSHLSTIELEYWWGPKFDDNLSKILQALQLYKANEQERLFAYRARELRFGGTFRIEEDA